MRTSLPVNLTEWIWWACKRPGSNNIQILATSTATTLFNAENVVVLPVAAEVYPPDISMTQRCRNSLPRLEDCHNAHVVHHDGDEFSFTSCYEYYQHCNPSMSTNQHMPVSLSQQSREP